MAVLRKAAALALLVAAAAARGEQVRVGDPLPAMTLTDRGGTQVELRGDLAPVVIVEIWASWCAPCRRSLPAVAALAAEHADRVRLFAVGIDRDVERAEAFLGQYLPRVPASVTVVRDAANEVASRFGAPGMPSLYAAEGGVVRLIVGGAGEDAEEQLQRLLEGSRR